LSDAKIVGTNKPIVIYECLKLMIYYLAGFFL